ncbi:MAG: septum formation protein Maf [Chitinophagia bacterium]|nr:septum formation protein Maf [Chitinophagia bacterium]
MSNVNKLILASASPRRKEILEAAGYEFEVMVPDFDEEEYQKKSPSLQDLPINLSFAKAYALRDQHKLGSEYIILGADTCVFTENSDKTMSILNKPKDEEDAKRMLQILSNSMHYVITGVTINVGNYLMSSYYKYAKVYFDTIPDKAIDYYIKHYKPFDKAGSYGIQDWLGMRYCSRIEGNFYAILGLPLDDHGAGRLNEFLKHPY